MTMRQENRLGNLEKTPIFAGMRKLMFAMDAIEAQGKLAAMTPSERESVIMVQWLPVQDPRSASTLLKPEVRTARHDSGKAVQRVSRTCGKPA